jgi:hypothetical protein
MSNLLLPVEARMLTAITGGAVIARGGTDDQLLSTLNTLQTTLANQTRHGGFTMTEAMMFGLMMAQRNSVVVVPRPFW